MKKKSYHYNLFTKKGIHLTVEFNITIFHTVYNLKIFFSELWEQLNKHTITRYIPNLLFLLFQQFFFLHNNDNDNNKS